MMPMVVPSTKAIVKPIASCLIVAQTFTQKSPERTISHISCSTSVAAGSTKGSNTNVDNSCQVPMNSTYPASLHV